MKTKIWKWIKTGAIVWALAIVFGPVVAPIFLRPAIAQGFLDAAGLDVLRQVILPSGIAGWPQHAADPVGCDAAAEGGYYFNTGTNLFKTCDGTSWEDREGAAALNDLSDVIITSPTNNQALIHNGSEFVNAAQGAAAINDHSDAIITTPNSGDIIEYDGADWINVAGASPTTFSGLSDTVISTPTDRQVVRFDGSDWINEDEWQGAPWVMFPINNAIDTHSNTTNRVVASANQVRAFCYNFDRPINIDRIIWAVDNVGGTNCDGGSVGIYTLDGLTKLIDSGVATYDTNDVTIAQDPADVYIPAGTYYIAYTSNGTTSSCTVLAEGSPGGTNDGYEDLWFELDAGSACAITGTASTQATAAALPATLGTVALNNGAFRPIIMFEGTDPP